MQALPKPIRTALSLIPGTTAITVKTQNGPTVIIKADRETALSMSKQGVVIAVTPQLSMSEAGSVFRLFIEFRDQPDSSVQLDTFLNPQGKTDLAVLRSLTQSATLDFYILDLALQPVGMKRIRWNFVTASDMGIMIQQAREYDASLPPGQLNYNAALADMKARNPLY